MKSERSPRLYLQIDYKKSVGSGILDWVLKRCRRPATGHLEEGHLAQSASSMVVMASTPHGVIDLPPEQYLGTSQV